MTIYNIDNYELLDVLRKYIRDNYDYKLMEIHEDCIVITTNEDKLIQIYLQVEGDEE